MQDKPKTDEVVSEPERLEPPEPAAAPEPSIDQRLEHIREISQNARTNWFGLLALLAFVGVALLGHKDADFFARGVETQLPLLNFSVPTRSFFLAASLLIAALYIYLHLYLLGLWDALADVPQRRDEPPLGDRVYPWLLAQTALWYRNRSRPDEPPSASPRVFAWLSVAVSVLFGWGFGVIVLGALWWRSMPAHEPWLTVVIGAGFAVSAAIGATTLATASMPT